MSTEILLSSRRKIHTEPNHRQKRALERIDYAVGRLSSVLLANCHSREIAHAAISAIGRAVRPVIADIIAAD